MSVRRPKTSDEFVAGAAATPEPARYPWLEPEVVNSEDSKSVNFYMPLAYKLKLKHIQKYGGGNQQSFLREVVFPAIDAKIAELTNGKG